MNVHKDKRNVVLVGFECAAALDITGPYEVFAVASHMAPESMRQKGTHIKL